MKRVGRNIAALLFFGTMFWLGGCANTVKVQLQSESDLNAGSSAAPLPVVVRIYLLNDDAAFKNADFRDLWKRDTEVLGKSLLASKEIVMQPNAKERIELPHREDARFIAGIAIFRNPSSSRWSFIDSMSGNFVSRNWNKWFSVSVSVRLTQNRIELIQ